MVEAVERKGGSERNIHCSISEVMKYVICFAIVVYVAILLIFSSGSRKSFKEVEKPLEVSIDSEKMQNVGVQGLKRFYGLNAADYEGVLLYNSRFNLSAEEVLMIKVKDDDQIHQVSVRGKFVFLSVGKKADKYKEIFSNNL